MRSAPRRVQNKLSIEHFGQCPIKSAGVLHTSSIRATPSYDITIQTEHRRTSHGLNYKRVAEVMEKEKTLAIPVLTLMRPSLSSQDSINTFSLQ